MERKTMETDGVQKFGGRRDELVAAVFFDDVTARDAIVDLKSAGFGASVIGVALSDHGKQVESAGGHASPSDLDGKHTIRWRFWQWFEHDLHTQGPGLSTEEHVDAQRERHPFTEIDLEQTLLRLGVLPATIHLLQDRMGPDGMLILVDARERVNEVESILVRNSGMLRTAMVTEQPLVTS
jgi:hypothetical protein